MYTRTPPGLGFPILPIILGVGSGVAALVGKKKAKVTREDAKKAIQNVFLELLERDPWRPEKYDQGAEAYVDCLMERERGNVGPGSCSIDDVRTNVLQSDEFRRLQEKRAAAVYGASSPAAVTTGGFPSLPPGASILDLQVGGIPVLYLIGGLALLMLMRRRR